MDYQRASLIRGTSLSSLIGERYSSGQGFGGSIRGALSDTLKAKAVGIKEYMDPLSWVRAATGKGAIGNIATAVAGRALGRSQRDIAYFGGYTRRRGTTSSSFSRTGGSSMMGGGTEMLEKIYFFLKNSSDQRRRMEQISRSFRQEQVNEDERRHKELLNALRNLSPGKTKTKFEGEEAKSPFQSLVDNFLSKIGDLIENILKGALGYKLMQKALGKYFPGKDGKGVVPDKEVTKTGAVGDSKSKRFSSSLTKAETEELAKKGYQFDEKRGVFTKDGKLVKTETVAKELGEAGEKKFAAAAGNTAGKQAVKEVVEKKVAKGGIKSFLKKIPLVGLGFGLMFGAARAMEGDNAGAAAELASGAVGAIPGVGAPLSLAADIGLLARDIYKDLYGVFPEDDDPDLRTDRKDEIIEALEEQITRLSPSSGETNLDTTDALAQGLETTGSFTPAGTEGAPSRPTATPVPMAESTAGAGRGGIGGPTAAELMSAENESAAESARLMRNAPPIPVQRDVPDITPMPELSSYMDSSQPIIQTNTNNNMINGSRDRVLATSPAKQRNTDLNRFLVRSSVPV